MHRAGERIPVFEVRSLASWILNKIEINEITDWFSLTIIDDSVALFVISLVDFSRIGTFCGKELSVVNTFQAKEKSRYAI